MIKKLVLAGMLLGTLQVAQAAPLVTLLDQTPAFSGSDAAFGWSFSTNRTLWVDALGYFDHNQDGLSTPHAVGLWNSAGALVASAVVNSSDVLSNGFRYSSLSSLLVLSPDTYVLAGFSAAGSADALPVNATFTTAPGVTSLETGFS